jgi:hypothetical protein
MVPTAWEWGRGRLSGPKLLGCKSTATIHQGMAVAN